MKRFLRLSLNDFRMIFRDPMLKGLIGLPLLVILLAVFLVPYLNARFPAFEAYNHIVLMGAGGQAATMFGFIIGFIFLEEKDENVFVVLKTMPVSGRFFVSQRLALSIFIAFLYNCGLMFFSKLAPMNGIEKVLMALQFSLLAPILALAVAVFARNKVEGLAQFKIYNLFVNLPLLIYFLDFEGLHFLAVLPSYWSFQSIEMLKNDGPFWFYHIIGWVVYFIFIAVLVKRFESKVF